MGKKIVILGAGISGLTTAYLLKQEGYDVTVLEKKSEVGGSIETIIEDGYLFDRGPNSALETTPLIAKFVDELNLHDQLVYANKEGNKRYILRDGKLHALPMSPPAFIKTKLFSVKAKLRLFLEPFIGRSDDGYYQSIAEFVKRRLGQEFLDYAINPFVAGVYAGRPEKLSVKSAFPKLYALEEKYGSLIIGSIRSARERKKRAEQSKQSAKMFSFKDGMMVLPKAIENHLEEKVKLNAKVISIEKSDDRYKIIFEKNNNKSSIDCDVVISTIPAYQASSLFKPFSIETEKHLNEIYYPPVSVLYLSYNKKDINRELDGFGYLIPEKEKQFYLGAIWSSVIFPGRVNDDKAAFTIFVGGARNPENASAEKDRIINKVRSEFESTMNISAGPVFSEFRYWDKAIPQYNIGYIEHENVFEKFEKENSGIILSGNYRGGISVGDCIKNSEVSLNKVKALIN